MNKFRGIWEDCVEKLVIPRKFSPPEGRQSYQEGPQGYSGTLPGTSAATLKRAPLFLTSERLLSRHPPLPNVLPSCASMYHSTGINW
ncbi:hypothetical protein SERLA73DRAFT_73989 [Serpula lacrymans var. lacrymans S7.3]|uniref:Uncharacterized protein n=1 Tax=Serpula lacrymans var. lacrymans (strain S7.3) TaxID=936435 RepID=F8PXD7_SERL3|nr:hypothetical protein SERLA73DRAFT_73989 [Serpula lacrymans var. lacrymans S7.3]